MGKNSTVGWAVGFELRSAKCSKQAFEAWQGEAQILGFLCALPWWLSVSGAPYDTGGALPDKALSTSIFVWAQHQTSVSEPNRLTQTHGHSPFLVQGHNPAFTLVPALSILWGFEESLLAVLEALAHSSSQVNTFCPEGGSLRVNRQPEGVKAASAWPRGSPGWPPPLTSNENTTQPCSPCPPAHAVPFCPPFPQPDTLGQGTHGRRQRRQTCGQSPGTNMASASWICS